MLTGLAGTGLQDGFPLSGAVTQTPWPIAMRLPLAAAEKITASVVLSLLATFGFTWVVYVWALPLNLLWTLQVLGTIGLALGLRPLAAAWHDADGRAVIIGQLLVTAWCVGWLATIAGAGRVTGWAPMGGWQRQLPGGGTSLSVTPAGIRPGRSGWAGS